MSDRSWMQEDENDFEVASCIGACGRLLRGSYDYKPWRGRPLIDSETTGADEGLNADHFEVHQTFRHGLPHQPSCLAYDSAQQLLAIGSHQGEIAIIGKAGLEKHLRQPDAVAVKEIVFVEEQGYMVTRCFDNVLYQWDIGDKCPKVVHTLEISKYQKPTSLSWSNSSPGRIYVGMDSGNVHLLSTDTFQRIDQSIFKDKILNSLDLRIADIGKLVDIAMHPSDSAKLLIGYEQVVVVWNLEKRSLDYSCQYTDETLPVVTSLSWKGDHNHFSVAYSTGVVLTYSCRVKSRHKHRSKIAPYKGNSSSISPCERVRYFNRDAVSSSSSSWIVFSGGYPEGRLLGVRTLTVHPEKNGAESKSRLLTFDEPIASFLVLSPSWSRASEAGALAVLTTSQLFVYDLLVPPPELPEFQLPHALSFDTSPVTCVKLCGNCPDDFMAKLQSYHTKMKDQSYSTRPWPLKGGQWGEEPWGSWSNLVLTGHMDGSVKVWCCQSVQMQFLFTIDTAQYFRQRQVRDRTRSASRLGSLISMPPAATPTSSLTSTSSLTPTAVAEDNCYFAVHTIDMDVHAQSLCVINGGGHVLVVDLIKRPPSFTGREHPTKTNSLELDFSCDSLIITKQTVELTVSAVSISHDMWHFSSSSSSQAGLPVFSLLQHCRCFFTGASRKLPVVVTAVKYCSDFDLLAIGSSHGLALVNTATNTCIKMLSHRVSLLYTADPINYQRDLSNLRVSKKPEPTASLTGHPLAGGLMQVRQSEPSLLDAQIEEECQSAHALREQLFPLLESAMPSSLTSTTFCGGGVSQQKESKQLLITCMELVNMSLSKDKMPVLMLWLGTACGHVVAYNVITLKDFGLQASGFVRYLRSTIISLFFVSEQGEKLLAPFRRRNEFGPKSWRSKPLQLSARLRTMSHHSRTSYAIVTTQRRIEAFAFPDGQDFAHNEPYVAGGEMVRSGFFYCKGLPCLLNLTSTGDILIHGLPKVQHLVTVPYTPLQESRVLHTFQVSGDGQALHFATPSEIQRLSVTRDDQLNLPACLPRLCRPPEGTGPYAKLMKGMVERGDKIQDTCRASLDLRNQATEFSENLMLFAERHALTK